MKSFKKSFLFIGIIFCFYEGSAQNGLIAYYPFDKESSNTNTSIIDYSKHQNNGTHIGNLSYVPDRHGVGCRAISFDGNSYITIPNSRSLSSPKNQFTVTVWVNIATGADFFKEWLTILCKSDGTQETSNSPHYRMQATAQTVSINTEFTELFTPSLSYDTWYFYAYVYDGRTVKVYLDGQFIFEQTYQTSLYPNTMPLEIGRDMPGAIEYFNGAMDELRLYNKALSIVELNQLYQNNSGAGQSSACFNNQASTAGMPIPKRKNQKDEVIKIPPDDPIYDGIENEVPVTEPAVVDDSIEIVKDTIADTYEDLPKMVDNRPVDYQKTIFVKGKDIKIYPYDNEKEDGDIVSININNIWVKRRYKIRNKKPKPYNTDYIKVSLNEGGNNYIISKALNVGSIPPNTLTLEIDDGISVQEIMINSDKGTSGGVRIVSE